MGGLSRYSAGRFDTFTQLNSGLPNDVSTASRCRATMCGSPLPPAARA